MLYMKQTFKQVKSICGNARIYFALPDSFPCDEEQNQSKRSDP